jgi:hypothetical protein
MLKRGDDAPMLVEPITQISAEVVQFAAPESGGVLVDMILERSVVHETAEKQLCEDSVDI